MKNEYEQEIAYVKVRTAGEGYSVIAKKKHIASLMHYLWSRDLESRFFGDVLPGEDILEFGPESDSTALVNVVNDWKKHYASMQSQKKELNGLKVRLFKTKGEEKKRVLRKHIRRIFIELNGHIRPQDFFTAKELKELEKAREADEKAGD